MANAFSIQKAKKSSLKRLPFLPRVGIVVDFGGHQFSYRQVPILETLVNAKEKGFSLKNLLDVAMKQFKEINLPPQPKTSVPKVQKKKK